MQLNSGQFGDTYLGRDLRVEQAWMQGLTGCNITVTVVDDGIIIYTAESSYIWYAFASSSLEQYWWQMMKNKFVSYLEVLGRNSSVST